MNKWVFNFQKRIQKIKENFVLFDYLCTCLEIKIKRKKMVVKLLYKI